MPTILRNAITAVERLYVGEHPLGIEDGAAIARYLKCRLSTRLSPLIGGGQSVGSHASLHVHLPSGLPVPARALFALASGGSVVRLDRLCRTLHTVNWLAAGQPGGSLHLPVHPRLVTAQRGMHGREFADALQVLGVDTRQIWMLLNAARSGPRLAEALKNYRALGLRTGLILAPQDASTAALLPAADAWYLDTCNWTNSAASALVTAAKITRLPLRLYQGSPIDLPSTLNKRLEAWPDVVRDSPPIWGNPEPG